MTFVIFIVVLSVLVFVHEAGHYLMAKALKIQVEEFAFGLPFTRALVSVKFRGTKYSIYPLLFGGFVRLYGEEGNVESEKKKSFWNRSKLQRMLVIVAGVIMNIVLALVGFGVLYGLVGIPKQTIEKVTLVAVAEDSPAQAAGLKVQDRIIEVEGREITSSGQFTALMKSWAGLGVNMVIERGEVLPLFAGLVEQPTTTEKVYLVPRDRPPEGQGPLGVQVTEVPFLQVEKCSITSLSCVGAIGKQGVISTGMWMGKVVDGLRQIGKSLVALKAPQEVSGPLGIYQITGLVAQQGLLPLIELVAILSVNLAVFNILPIPALDGGRALFIWIEKFRGKRLTAEFEQRINGWGMAVLLTLVALITLQDLLRMGIVNKLLGK